MTTNNNTTNKAASSSPNCGAPISGNVRVVARVRPLSEKELKQGSSETIVSLKKNLDHQNGNNQLVQQAVSELLQVQESGSSKSSKKRWFELDAVFDKNSTQKDVYVKSGTKQSICDDIFKGFNCTILAYGQTGAGKTFTMGTDISQCSEEDKVVVDDMHGVIPRACHDLFDTIEDKCDGNAKVELSYLEIYNEELRDLLADDNNNNNDNSNNNQVVMSTSSSSPLKIRETLNGEIYVSGLKKREVKSPGDIMELMQVASKRRVVAATAMNAVSSRSHAMCILRIQGIVENSNGKTQDKFTSKLTLVDLAGSERIKKTGAEGNRAKEGININKSLLVLGQVVSALATANMKSSAAKQKLVKPPYRDSKLTRLLQDSLGGNSRTIMVACVSPADINADESINTLRYATNARNIKNSATRNLIRNISQEEAAKLQRENQLLKQQVAELQDMLQMITFDTDNMSVNVADELLDVLGGDSEKSRVLLGDNSSERSPTMTTRSTGGGGKVNRFSDTSTMTKFSCVPSVYENGAGAGGPVVDMYQHKAAEDRIKELEEEVQTLKRQMANSQRNVRKSAAHALEVPALRAHISILEEELDEAEELKSENIYLREELEQVRMEAESSRQAHNILSERLERVEYTEKSLKYDHLKKEDAWLNFCCNALEQKSDQMKQLSKDCDSLLSAMGTVSLIAGISNSSNYPSSSSSWWPFSGGDNNYSRSNNNDFANQKVQISIKSKAEQLEERIDKIKIAMGVESSSLRSIQTSLQKDCKDLYAELEEQNNSNEQQKQQQRQRRHTTGDGRNNLHHEGADPGIMRTTTETIIEY